MALRSSQYFVGPVWWWVEAAAVGEWFCRLLVVVVVGPEKGFCLRADPVGFPGRPLPGYSPGLHLLEPGTYCCKLLCGAVVVWVVR